MHWYTTGGTTFDLYNIFQKLGDRRPSHSHCEIERHRAKRGPPDIISLYQNQLYIKLYIYFI